MTKEPNTGVMNTHSPASLAYRRRGNAHFDKRDYDRAIADCEPTDRPAGSPRM